MVYLGTSQVVILLISIAVVVIGGYLALHFTVISNLKLKRKVKELNIKFEYLHALLIGEDSQLVKRLEIISRTNLLYVDIHSQFNKRYKEIRDQGDSEAQAAINEAKDLLQSKNYKELKIQLPKIKDRILSFEKVANSLNKDLITIIKPEEDCRQTSLGLKEKIRTLKQEYYIRQTDLGLLNDSFEIVFENFEKCFTEFEKYVESAQYDEANELLSQVDQIITQLNKIFPSLPGICTTITSIIPEKILSLKEKHKEMLEKGYPLNHLNVMSAIDEINGQLEGIKVNLAEFNVGGINEKLDGILGRISDFFESFQQEETAKETFDTECDEVYALDTSIDKRYIKLCNALPEVKKIFTISSVQQDNISVIRDNINKTGATKRSLDTFIHSGTLQPYTVLVGKMHALRNEASECSKLLDEFDSYLLSLKNDAENCATTLSSTYETIKQKEHELRDTDIQITIDKYLPKFKDVYSLIDYCFATLNSTPIDIQKANSLVDDFKFKANELLLELGEVLTSKEQAEKAIIYANRDRIHLSDLHQILKQTESLYFSGDYQTSLNETNHVLQSIRSGEK